MNFFSSTPFLAAAQRAFYSNGSTEIETIQVEGLPFRLLLGKREKHAILVPFQDFLEPIRSEPLPAKQLRYLPNVCRKSIPLTTWQNQQSVPKSVSPSPYIDWIKFSSWNDYVTFTQNRSMRAFRKKRNAYNLKRLKREIGEVCFEFCQARRELLKLCFEWKSAQYRSSKLVDGLAEGSKVRKLFEFLFEEDMLTISSMTAGNNVIAVHVGVIWDKRFYYWLPAYGVDYRKYSAGRILLEKLMEWSYTEGHQEFDFLLGDEEYKYLYATDVRCVEALGIEPFEQRIWSSVRPVLMKGIRKNPKLYSLLQTIKRELMTRSLR